MMRVTWQGGRKVIEPVEIAPVSPLQARRALAQAGLLAKVEEIVSASPEAYMAWEYAVEIRRDDPMIDALSIAAGLTPGTVDALFRRAAML